MTKIKPIDIFNEENDKFFKEKYYYEKKHGFINEDGEFEFGKIMPHKGFNFSASYDAIEKAMERWAKIKLDEYILRNNGK